VAAHGLFQIEPINGVCRLTPSQAGTKHGRELTTAGKSGAAKSSVTDLIRLHFH